MIKVTKFQTADGVLHDTQDEATRHLSGLYANALSKLSHSLVINADKYSKAAAWINDNLDNFRQLSAINADMVLADDQEEE